MNIKNIFTYVRHPSKLIIALDGKGCMDWMADKQYLKIMYWAIMHKKLNLKNPQTFNEKLQWLKLYDRNPEYIRMVDKYEAKKYVAEKIGEEYIIPTLGVWDSFDDIDFTTLSNQFVLKTTHDSGSIIICKDKNSFDYEQAKKSLANSLQRDYYLEHREWPYKNVKRRIIAEKFMVDESGYELKDYKLMCFNGKVNCSFVCSERYSSDSLKVTFFDKEWNVLPFERHYPKSKTPINKPQNYEKMVELAEKLSKNIPFVRVDFYEVEGKIYFGEITFYPGSGFEEFNPDSTDTELGKLIELPVSLSRVTAREK